MPTSAPKLSPRKRTLIGKYVVEFEQHYVTKHGHARTRVVAMPSLSKFSKGEGPQVHLPLLLANERDAREFMDQAYGLISDDLMIPRAALLAQDVLHINRATRSKAINLKLLAAPKTTPRSRARA